MCWWGWLRTKQLQRLSPARRICLLALCSLLLLAACDGDSQQLDNLPIVNLDEFRTMLAASERPVVVNVWASWCLPCRDEAPLLTAAHADHGEEVAFVGVAFNDNQPGARDFLAEFDLPFPHYFDQEGVVLAEYGGIGVPRTYFFAPGGELVSTINGVLNSDTLALQIEELLKR